MIDMIDEVKTVLRRTKGRLQGVLHSLLRRGKLVWEVLQIHGLTALTISLDVSLIAILVLTLLDPVFRSDLLNRMESSRLAFDNALQGASTSIANGFSTFAHIIARHFGGY